MDTQLLRKELQDHLREVQQAREEEHRRTQEAERQSTAAKTRFVDYVKEELRPSLRAIRDVLLEQGYEVSLAEALDVEVGKTPFIQLQAQLHPGAKGETQKIIFRAECAGPDAISMGAGDLPEKHQLDHPPKGSELVPLLLHAVKREFPVSR